LENSGGCGGDPVISTLQKSSANSARVSGWSSRFLVAAALMLATAIGLQLHSQNEVLPPRQALASLPREVDVWTGTDDTIDEQALELLGHPEYLLRDYVNTRRPEEAINLFIAYYPTQKVGETPHTPAHCLPGAGWTPTSREIVHISGPDGTSFPANRYVVSKTGDRQLVLYWFQAHGRRVASEYRLKYYLVSDSIRMHRSDGALVRLMAPMYQDESADAAQARVMQLGNELLPMLDHYIPR
jgi:EpsI family protein